jgi:hypothetical protein
MPGVRFSSATNSTLFTTCCSTAICDDQSRCPACKAEVVPRSPRGRWEMAMQAWFGIKKLRVMRAEYAAGATIQP